MAQILIYKTNYYVCFCCLQMKSVLTGLDLLLHVKRVRYWNTALYMSVRMLYGLVSGKLTAIIKP